MISTFLQVPQTQMLPFVHFATAEYKDGVLSPSWVCLFLVLAMHYKGYLCLLIFLSLSDVYHQEEAVFSAVVYWKHSLHLSFLLWQKHPASNYPVDGDASKLYLVFIQENF